MREGLGSAVMIAIIAVFIAIVSAYLAFNVNYMKAFNMKNRIVDYFNRYEGKCTNTANECYKKIEEYAKSIGYEPLTMNCSGGYGSSKYFCYRERTYYESSESPDVNDIHQGSYYEIVTKVNINIPIVKNVFSGIGVFNVKGNTKVFNNKK